MTNQQIITGLQIILKGHEISLRIVMSTRGKGVATEIIEDEISTLKAAIEKISACESLESSP